MSLQRITPPHYMHMRLPPGIFFQRHSTLQQHCSALWRRDSGTVISERILGDNRYAGASALVGTWVSVSLKVGALGLLGHLLRLIRGVVGASFRWKIGVSYCRRVTGEKQAQTNADRTSARRDDGTRSAGRPSVLSPNRCSVRLIQF